MAIVFKGKAHKMYDQLITWLVLAGFVLGFLAFFGFIFWLDHLRFNW